MADKKRIWWSVGLAGLGAVALLCAGLLVTLRIELQNIRPRLESVLGAVLQREVLIEGEVSVGLSLTPELVARGIRIGNPAWASRDHLAYVERAEIRFELVPLLRERRVVVSDLEFSGADVRLEQREDGTDNWTTAGAAPANWALLEIDRLQIEDSVVVLQRPDAAASELFFDEFEATSAGSPIALTVEASGRYRDWPFDLEGAGRPADDATGPGAWPFELEIDVGELRMELDGAFAELFRLSGLAFDLSVARNDRGRLSQLFGAQQPDVDYRLATAVRFSDRGFRLQRVRAVAEQLGPIAQLVVTDGEMVYEDRALELSSRGRLDDTPFEISLLAPEIVKLADLADFRMNGRIMDAALDIDGTVGRTNGKLDLNAELSLAIPRLQQFSDLLKIAFLPQETLEVAAHLTASDGLFDLRDITARLGDSRLTGGLTLGTTAGRPVLRASFDSPELDIRSLVRAEAMERDQVRDRSVLDTLLPTAWLTAIDLEVNGQIDAIAGVSLPLRDVSFAASVMRGRLSAERFGISVAGVPWSGTGTLTGGDDPSMELRAHTERLETDAVLRTLGLPDYARGAAQDVELHLLARGRSLREALDRGDLALTVTSGDLLIGTPEVGLADLHLDGLRLVAARSEPVRLTVSGSLEERPFELLAGAGPLHDLLPGADGWTALDLSLTTPVLGQTLNVAGTLRPFDALLRGEGGSVELATELGGVRAQAGGALTFADGFLQQPLEVRLTSEDPAELVLMLNLPVGLAGPFEASGTLSHRGGSLSVRDLQASTRYGELLHGDVSITRMQPPRVDAALEFASVDLDALLASLDIDASGSAGPTVFPRQRLSLVESSVLELVSRLRIGDLRVLGARLSGVDGAVSLEPGRFGLEGKTDDGRASVLIELDGRSAPLLGRIDLGLRDHVASAPVADGEAPSALSVDVSLTGRGATVAEIMGSANGEVSLWGGPGSLNQTRQSAFLVRGLFRQILGALIPVSKAPLQNKVTCSALFLEVEEGIASAPRGIAIQTEDLNVLGAGAVNLQTEELQLRFRFQPRRGLGLSLAGMAAPFVNVSGTLLSPQVNLDAGTSVASGVAAWASGGMSLLYTGFIRRLFAARRPCERVLPEPPADLGAADARAIRPIDPGPSRVRMTSPNN